jgi:hypothetical protein
VLVNPTPAKRPVKIGDFNIKDNSSIPNLDIAGVVDGKQMSTNKKRRALNNSQSIRTSAKNIVFKPNNSPTNSNNQYGLHDSMD